MTLDFQMRQMRLIPPGNRPRASNDDHLIPLINVVFLMLIFFMIAGSIVPPTPFPVTPPASTEALAEAGDGIVLVLDADGRLALDGEVIPPDELAGRLARQLAARPSGQAAGRPPELAMATPAEVPALASPATTIEPAPPTLILKADAELPIALLRATLEQLRAAGVERVSLLTLRNM